MIRGLNKTLFIKQLSLMFKKRPFIRTWISQKWTSNFEKLHRHCMLKIAPFYAIFINAHASQVVSWSFHTSYKLYSVYLVMFWDVSNMQNLHQVNWYQDAYTLAAKTQPAVEAKSSGWHSYTFTTWTPQKIVDCKVGLCTSLWTVAEFL